MSPSCCRQKGAEMDLLTVSHSLCFYCTLLPAGEAGKLRAEFPGLGCELGAANQHHPCQKCKAEGIVLPLWDVTGMVAEM